jgi:hypothetical protein
MPVPGMSAPKVWDLLMLNNELDMLECRLREFEDTDTIHVLCESDTDHRGHPKPLHYAENRERFAPWSERIVHIAADSLPLAGPPCPTCTRGAPWITEHAQRDRTWAAVEDQAADSDVILLGDVDEFPSAEALEGTFPVATLSQRLAMYAVDWLVPDPHLCSVVASGRYMRGKRPSGVRDGRYGYYVLSGGWHLTWLGGQDGQRRKLATTCHLEMRDDELQRLASGECYRTGIHHAGDLQLLAADVDETWPRWIYERKAPASWYRPRGAA